MRAAANFAWANRQLLMQQSARSSPSSSAAPGKSLQMNLVYDVAHNIAKIEDHAVDGAGNRSASIARGRRGRFPPAIPNCPPPIVPSASR